MQSIKASENRDIILVSPQMVYAARKQKQVEKQLWPVRGTGQLKKIKIKKMNLLILFSNPACSVMSPLIDESFEYE